jgi:hypothetical protein
MILYTIFSLWIISQPIVENQRAAAKEVLVLASTTRGPGG